MVQFLDDVLVGTGFWFMQRWSAPALTAAISEVCSLADSGRDYETVATRISRSIPWEFEYRYDERVDEQDGETH